jgi:molybdate transport system substrate-binding protein
MPNPRALFLLLLGVVALSLASAINLLAATTTAPATRPLLMPPPATQPAEQTALVVSAASSLQDALPEIAAGFGKQTGITVHFNFLASGQLAAQIEQGAPVDLFISASPAQVQELVARDLVFGKSVDLAGNELALIVPKDATNGPKDFFDLSDPRIKRICIGEPSAVPAGNYAGEVLRKLGLAAAVQPRLVYGANVRQVLQYVQRGEVDAGIVYVSDAKAAGDAVRVVATADPKWHSPIIYEAAVIAASDKKNQARDFLKFILSDAGWDIMLKYGFEPASYQRTQAVTP